MPRLAALGAGISLYAALVLGLYGLYRLPLPEAVVLLNAVKAVGPGFAAGWLLRAQGLSAGAAVGGAGGVLEMAFLAYESELPFGVPDRLAYAAVYTVIGAALTNALGGAAAEALGARRGR